MRIETHKNFLESRTYGEINIGDSSTLVRTLPTEDVKLFAIMSGDMNPAIGDLEYSNSGMFREVVAHGMWSTSLISTVLGTQFPGPGTVLVDQSLRFMQPVRLGDTLTITVTAKQKFEHNHHVVFDCNCVNQDGMPVVLGTAEVLAPAEKNAHPARRPPGRDHLGQRLPVTGADCPRQRTSSDRHGRGSSLRPRIAERLPDIGRSRPDRSDPDRA